MSLRHRWEAWGELWQRYREVFRHYWKQRDALSLPRFEVHEAEFLPAALSLQAQPVSPAGRWVARILMLLIVVLLLWSILGKVDIIVNATGKIIPSERTKTIAAVEVATVRKLHVEEGQIVKAGDVLIELDARASDSERDKALGNEQLARLQAARSRALIEALDHGGTPHLPPLDGIPSVRWNESEQHLVDQWRDYTAKLNRLDGEIRRYAEALPLATQRARDYADLAKDHDVSQHAYLEKEQARIDTEGQLREARDQKTALTAETRRVAQDSLTDAKKVLGESSEDARRASVHSEQLKLVAPVSGTVQQLTVHTVGTAVPVAQPLMQIVPEQSVVEVEAFLENKDVGFVQEGQEAQVKIDTFEYTKYGTIPARVTHVSRDAIEDEKKGLIYSVLVTLDKTSIDVDGRKIKLSPGMSTTVEIKTGTRRVIEYVLSPLIQHARESLRER
ncbi:HlyD family type I secretion periplasmic adaptor subunit [Ralstonia pseudosolanacearum]|uniref:HlyD family type I secretion periplasmic adaptor subunit n=1 Tax=Ralstonia pseudosolanacearum TaxID=1310165 RepID=UPI001FF803CC|nr:HlyD family type I secretion periplasmic adaptor subunit [Ralstonia pseudosolanacearum]